MPELLRLTALTCLTRLLWTEQTQTATDPLAGPPLEFRTQDGDLFMTVDGVYFGVTDRE